MILRYSSTLFITLLVLAFSEQVTAQTDTTFTYQGELTDGGEPANGSHNFQFGLWDADVGGSQIGTTAILNGIPVTDGKFTVELDFGASAFDNTGRWLEIVVNGITLSPRNPITRSPYSVQTRGIFVDDEGDVGIGTTEPAVNLHIAGTRPEVRLQHGSVDGNYTRFWDYDLARMKLLKYSTASTVKMDFSPMPGVGAGARIRFFRDTYAPGDEKVVQFMRGDGTASSISAQIGVDGVDSFFQAHGGNLGIGTTSPTAALDVVGDSTFRNRLRVGYSGGDLFGQLNVIDSNDGSPFGIYAYMDNSTFPTIFTINPTGPSLWAQGFSDASLAGGGVVVVGDNAGTNLAIDDDEIMARDGSSPAALHLNAEGGDINMGQHNIHPAFAYGKVADTGSPIAVSQNVSAVHRLDEGDYEILVDGDAHPNDIVIVTTNDQVCIVGAFVDSGVYRVRPRTRNFADPIDTAFSFIVYRP